MSCAPAARRFECPRGSRLKTAEPERIMPEGLEPYVLCFVPLFAAMDPIGIAPIFLSTAEGRSPLQRRRMIIQALATALGVGSAFLFLGRWILDLLGVTVSDFAIAGGLLLLIIAVRDLLGAEKALRKPDLSSGERDEVAGVVPLGIPLIVGPAVVTTTVLLVRTHGLAPTLAAFGANLMLVGLVFWKSDLILKLLGRAASKALSKVVSLLLAAIAVKMIRVGVEEVITRTT